MLKKLVSCVSALLIGASCAAMTAGAAAKTVFSDDFSSGKFDKWTNPAIDNDPDRKDTECEGVAQIKGGAMAIENISKTGSFFYIGAKGVNMLDFTITLKVKANQFKNGWLGVSFRKDVNDRFNGCNNNMVTLRFQPDKSIASQAYRGYTGSPPAALSNKTDAAYRGDVSGFVTWRLEVSGSSFKSYVNNELIGDWEYKKNANAGALSINACLFDGAVDDVVITEYEAGATPTTGKTQAPTKAPDKPTASGNTTKPGGTTKPAQSDVSEPDTQTTASGSEDGGFIKSIYKDVTVDNTFGAVTLTKNLKVKDLLVSFKLSDGYALQVVDADGAAVEDEDTAVTDAMKLLVTKGGETVKTYTISLNAGGGADESSAVPADGKAGAPVGLIVGIVAAVLVLGGGVTVLILWKKGRLFKKA